MTAPLAGICGCCEGVRPLTPSSRENLPGLSALAYRVGTHARFKATMQAALVRFSALAQLTTREDDDPAIALLDAWAAVADVLAFYQERIANEGYLRTATERMSVLELARAIGYELNPGVAASTCLAFTLEDAPGAPGAATINIGTKVQSLPGPGELPQTFETIEVVDARAEWNALRPRLTELLTPRRGTASVWLKGSALGLKPGDALLLVGDERSANPASERWDFRRAKTVTADAAAGRTLVTWDEGLGWRRPGRSVEPAAQSLKVYAFRQRAALFGHNAPEWRAMPGDLKKGYLPGQREPTSADIEWPGFEVVPRGLQGEYFDGSSLTNSKLIRIDPQIDFAWGTGSPHPSIAPDTFSVRWTGWVQPRTTGVYTFFTLSDDGVRLWVNNVRLINNWTQHGPTENSGTLSLRAGELYPVTLEYFEAGGGATIQLSWSGPNQPKEIIPSTRLPIPDPITIHLDAVYPQIVAGSWIVLSIPEYQELYQVSAAVEASQANFTLTAKTTRLTLTGENLSLYDEKRRETVVFGQSELLEIAETPVVTPVSGDRVTLDRLVEGLAAGRTVILSGLSSPEGEAMSEVLEIDSLQTSGGLTTVVFTNSLAHSYQRDTVTINANVALATHGETKEEILGSGDSSQPLQTLALKNSPLTYVSAPTPSGGASTLEVRVNDILWEAASTFLGRSPRDPLYLTQIADDGKVKVQFGDGISGARLPTGTENVKARYRVGTGLAGMVKAGQLSLLMTRPLGVKGVTNPLTATGAADPQALEQARENAPLTVLTLDRIVSLRDFEDFARAFSGIGKAQATWLWAGETRLVHLTVGAADGGRVDAATSLHQNLQDGIAAARDPIQSVRIDSYLSLQFKLEARILAGERYVRELVVAAVSAALESAFSFAARDFGQGVTQSEVLAVIQGVEGVEAADLDKLFFAGARAVLNPHLPAHTAHWDESVSPPVLRPAELLTLSTDGITLTEMQRP
jgi:predicted phage baseplate assembly protein